MRYPANRIWNRLRHNWCKILLLGCLAGTSADALAVTEEEMNNAEAIAAKTYIRFVNNNSGYLDEFTPSSMADLENHLTNDKDRGYLKDFQKATVASDYASWGKDKLAEYWSTTFFQNNQAHLDSKAANNGLAKLRIKKAISNMKVTEPSAEPAPAPEPQAETSTEPQTSQPENNANIDPLEEYRVDKLEEEEDKIAALKDSIAAAEQASAKPEKEEKSGTWVYIMVLCILVVVVIALVAYASRTMKGSKKSKYDEDDIEPIRLRREPVAPVRPAEHPVYSGDDGFSRANVEEARMREKYAQNLAAKTEEIMQLTRQLTDMEMQAAQLKEENRLLKLELERTRSKKEEAPKSVITSPAASQTSSHPSQGSGHEVFLGRVNSRGIFVRADRQPVEGQSIYKLRTSNGISGTFSVVSNSILDRQLLSDPEKWLSGGCFASDLYDTAGRYKVVTETTGTAVFKDGAWRVERKAKIRYE